MDFLSQARMRHWFQSSRDGLGSTLRPLDVGLSQVPPGQVSAPVAAPTLGSTGGAPLIGLGS